MRRYLARIVVVAPLLWVIFFIPVALADDFTTVFQDAIAASESGDFLDAEEKFRHALKLSPASVDALLHLGLAQAYQKKYIPALETIEWALMLSPRNLDLRKASARIKGWSGRIDEARRDAREIVESMPTDAEAHILVARLAYYAGDMEAAEGAYQRALDIDPKSSEAREGLNIITQARIALTQKHFTPEPTSPSALPLWRLDTGYSTSHFNTDNRPYWHEGYINLARKLDNSTLSARIERARRFGLDDTYIRIGIDHQLTDGVTGYVQAGGTSGADFLARWTLETGGSVRLWEGNEWIGSTLVTIDLKQKDYATGDVRNADTGLKQYLFNERLWLTVKRINTRDVAAGKTHPGWTGQIDLSATENLHLFAGYADTGESEQGTTAKTKSRFFGLATDITPDLGVNLSYTRDDRETIYIRKVFAAGVTFKF